MPLSAHLPRAGPARAAPIVPAMPVVSVAPGRPEPCRQLAGYRFDAAPGGLDANVRLRVQRTTRREQRAELLHRRWMPAHGPAVTLVHDAPPVQLRRRL